MQVKMDPFKWRELLTHQERTVLPWLKLHHYNAFTRVVADVPGRGEGLNIRSPIADVALADIHWELGDPIDEDEREPIIDCVRDLARLYFQDLIVDPERI